MKPTNREALVLIALIGLLGWMGPASAGRYVAARNPIPNQYLVILKGDETAVDLAAANASPGLEASKRRIVSSYGAQVTAQWGHAIRGFAVSLSPEKARELANDPDVALIEEDSPVSLFATQANAPWHLDRIDQASLPLDQLYSFNSTGRGVNAYIIDSGIRADHVEFAGNRVKAGYSVVNDGRGTNDCHGHGTHVAGILGGVRYGVAKEVNLYPVRVFSCSGGASNSQVLDAIDWVSGNHVKPAVVNMSLGGTGTVLTTAVENLVRRGGITVVVAAGNSNADACNTSPANAPSAITVAASTATDARATFSNRGSCVDIFAPGMSVTSAGISTASASKVMNGTSMAAPVVAGVISRMLSAGPLNPEEVWSRLRSAATANTITDPRGAPNLLVYATGDGTPPPKDTQPPTVSLVAPTNGQTLSGKVTLSANAQDNAGISKVEFYASNSTSGTEEKLLGSTTSPVSAGGRYELQWNSQGLADGAYALRARATDTSQNTTNSPITNVTVFNPIPEACSTTSQLLANAGFESGRTAWVERSSTNVPIIVQSSERRSGAWVGKLRGVGRAGTDTLSQNVLVPADTCSAKLDFWFKKTKSVSTRPARGMSSNDRFRVEIVAVSLPGKPVTLLKEYTEADLATNVYVSRSFDLSAFMGQTVEIRFSGIEDSFQATTYWVDDVALNVVK